MKNLLWCAFFLISFGNLYAQDFQPKGSLKIDVAIPVVLQNKALKKTQQGLLNLGVSYQHAFKGFVIGGGARYNYFNLNEFALQERMQGGLHQVGGFAKLGYERFLTDRLSIDVGVRGGYLQMFSKSTYNDSIIGGSYKAGTWFIEPVAHVSYLASESSAFFFQIAYNIQLFNYGPEFLSVSEIPPYTDADNSKDTQFITFGFGYSYFFGRSKKKSGR
jgi:hypothetical protein